MLTLAGLDVSVTEALDEETRFPPESCTCTTTDERAAPTVPLPGGVVNFSCVAAPCAKTALKLAVWFPLRLLNDVLGGVKVYPLRDGVMV